MIDKTLYKIELLLLKYLSVTIGLCYLLNTILSYFGIDFIFLSIIAGLSILPAIFILVSSYVFKFCIYYRLPVYYAIVSDIINYYDLYIGIPLSNRMLFVTNMISAGICIFLMIFFKIKLCNHH